MTLLPPISIASNKATWDGGAGDREPVLPPVVPRDRPEVCLVVSKADGGDAWAAPDLH